MKTSLRLAGLFLVGCLSLGCAQNADALDNPLGKFLKKAVGQDTPGNVVVWQGLRIEAKWCDVSPERAVECEVEITSLYKDLRAGLVYPKMQDQDGNETRLARKDGTVGAQVLVAEQPYRRRFTASNLPTYSKQVRSIVTGLVINDLRNLKTGEHPQLIFTDIPVKPVMASAPSPLPAPVATPAPAPQPASVAQVVSNSYWHGVIVPVVDMPSSQIIDLWKRGAYIHFRADGIAGYNWSTPNGYIYDAVNSWKADGDTFTLSMPGATYVFTTNSEQPLTTFVNEGGLFKMTMTAKSAKQE